MDSPNLDEFSQKCWFPPENEYFRESYSQIESISVVPDGWPEFAASLKHVLQNSENFQLFSSERSSRILRFGLLKFDSGGRKLQYWKFKVLRVDIVLVTRKVSRQTNQGCMPQGNSKSAFLMKLLILRHRGCCCSWSRFPTFFRIPMAVRNFVCRCRILYCQGFEV